MSITIKYKSIVRSVSTTTEIEVDAVGLRNLIRRGLQQYLPGECTDVKLSELTILLGASTDRDEEINSALIVIKQERHTQEPMEPMEPIEPQEPQP